MSKVNCNQCIHMYVDSFTGVFKCDQLNCGCHLEESNFFQKVGEPVPRRVPDLGVKACPGMVQPKVAQ